MSELISIDCERDVAVVTINNPPVNALSPAVVTALGAAFTNVLNDGSIRAVVLIGAGRAFCGGADIKQFTKLVHGQPHIGHLLNPVLNAIELANKPVVAAIHGIALGGGLEMAMACHFRLASSNAVLGQPEVKLGLIPGAGGTQRLPRLAGLKNAAEWCAFGGTMSAHDALTAGVIDQCFEGDLRTAAIRFADGVTTIRRTRDIADRLGDRTVITAIREQVKARSPKLLAAKNAVEAVEAAGRLSFDEGMAAEARLFEKCLYSEEAQALVHVFLSEREVGKVPDAPREAPPPIRKIAILGDGPHADAIKSLFARLEITDATNDADAIIESVPDDLSLKQKVLADAAAIARHDAILMSTTATLDIGELAAATSRPEYIIGFHVLEGTRVVEIVRGKDTHARCVAAALALAKSQKMIGVVVRGPVAHRLLTAYQLVVPGAMDFSDVESRSDAVQAISDEGMQIVNEGLALRTGDLDIIAINGLRFPAHLGGPMWMSQNAAKA